MSGQLPLTLDLTIAIDTALSIGASGASVILADRVAIRDGHDRLIVPGSHIKGKLRHACEEIARALGHTICEAPRAEAMCPQFDDPNIPRFHPDGTETTPDDPQGRPRCVICQLFGSPGYRSPLRFGDLIYRDPVWGDEAGDERLDSQPTLRPGIGLDRKRRVVEEKLLFFVETSPLLTLEPGLAVFRGERAIVGRLEKRAQAYLLLAGLAFIKNWGGGRSRGLGWGQVRVKGSVADEALVYPPLEGMEVLREL